MTPIRLALGLLSPGGHRAALTVMIFHRVYAHIDPVFPDEPDAKRFEALMRRVRDWFRILPLSEAFDRLRVGSLPARAAAVTFDDGYADNCTVALPILERLCIPATFFIATGHLDGGRMWNDTVIEAVRAFAGNRLDLTDLELGAHPTATFEERRRAIDMLLPRVKYLTPGTREETAEAIAERTRTALPTDLMLTSAQVREMHARGMGFGAHTVSHPILAKLSETDARREIADSKARLESIIGEQVDLFAYPNGKPGRDYRREHVELVKALGFRAAVSTAWGAARVDCDLFQVPRFTPWDQVAWRYGIRMAQNITRSGSDCV